MNFSSEDVWVVAGGWIHDWMMLTAGLILGSFAVFFWRIWHFLAYIEVTQDERLQSAINRLQERNKSPVEEDGP